MAEAFAIHATFYNQMRKVRNVPESAAPQLLPAETILPLIYFSSPLSLLSSFLLPLSFYLSFPMLLKLIKFNLNMGPWPGREPQSVSFENSQGLSTQFRSDHGPSAFIYSQKDTSQFQPLFSDWPPELSNEYLLLILKLSCSELHEQPGCFLLLTPAQKLTPWRTYGLGDFSCLSFQTIYIWA